MKERTRRFLVFFAAGLFASCSGGGGNQIVTPPPANVTVAITSPNPLPTAVGSGGTLQFGATVTGSSNVAVIWTATPAAAGTINKLNGTVHGSRSVNEYNGDRYRNFGGRFDQIRNGDFHCNRGVHHYFHCAIDVLLRRGVLLRPNRNNGIRVHVGLHQDSSRHELSNNHITDSGWIRCLFRAGH